MIKIEQAPGLNEDGIIGLANKYGRPVSFHGQELLMHVRYKKGFHPQSSGGQARSYPHTDLAWSEKVPKKIFMYCVESSGGQSGLSSYTILDEILSDFSNHQISALEKEKVFFPAPKHTKLNGFEGSVLSKGPSVRFNSRDIRSNLSECLSDFFDRSIEYERYISLESGVFFILDNRSMLHGRSRVFENDTSRHLIRIYLD